MGLQLPILFAATINILFAAERRTLTLRASYSVLRTHWRETRRKLWPIIITINLVAPPRIANPDSSTTNAFARRRGKSMRYWPTTMCFLNGNVSKRSQTRKRRSRTHVPKRFSPKRLRQKRFRDVSKRFRPATFPGAKKTFPKRPRNVLETFPKRSRNVPETFPKRFRNVPGTFRNVSDLQRSWTLPKRPQF